jgi:hypothetical protein
MRRTVLIACAALVLAPSIALAQAKPAAKPAPTKPTTANSALQTQLAGKLLDFIDYRNGVRLRMSSSGLPPELVAVRPDWDPIFRQALADELDHDMPVIESMIGVALGKTFSVNEMQAGLKIVADPGLKAIYTAAQNHAPEPPGAAVSKETDALMDTPAGGSFVKKLQTISDVMDPVQIEVMATLMPGVFKRFGEKAEAAEVTKRAAAGYAAAR